MVNFIIIIVFHSLSYYYYYYFIIIKYFLFYLIFNFFPVTKLSHLFESFLVIGSFRFLHCLCIEFPTTTRRL